jgi:hypothetical protein
MLIEKIISGGQTGVDRAALDAAIEISIPHGGWCPKGRLAELGGIIPDKYLLKETESKKFSVRTKLNIEDSDGTLILVPQLPLNVKDGTTLTIRYAKKKNKPLLLIDLSNPCAFNVIKKWINDNNIKTLNIAGPRESKSPEIYAQSLKFIKQILYSLK